MTSNSSFSLSSTATNKTNEIKVPRNAGTTIATKALIRCCNLMTVSKFVDYCKQRNISVDRERLFNLESHGLFAPVFRVQLHQLGSFPIYLPKTAQKQDTPSNTLVDTTAVPQDHAVPHIQDRCEEAYYSKFQIIHLERICSSFTLQVHLDSYLPKISNQKVGRSKSRVVPTYSELADRHARRLRQAEHLRAIALLCQHISNRYYPPTQSNGRTFPIRSIYYADDFIVINGSDWSWNVEVSEWEPNKVEQYYQLSQENLQQAYELLSIRQAGVDPLEKWYELMNFVSPSWRSNLRGDALKAKTIREGALMLGFLYRDLYGESLNHPNEVSRTVFIHQPELHARDDPRRYLEFVVNRFDLNPQVRLCLFVEGQTEFDVISELFKRYFNFHPGAVGIEIVVLGGVDNATGGKREKYIGMVRIIDYLHSHHTHAFLILDRENHSPRLKQILPRRVSIHHDGRRVTSTDWVKIWQHSFEFDNYSNTEIRNALNELANHEVTFDMIEISAIRNSEKKVTLGSLYLNKMSSHLSKRELNRILARNLFDPSSRRQICNRKIVKLLSRIVDLATKHHLPYSIEGWESYQKAGRFGTRVVQRQTS